MVRMSEKEVLNGYHEWLVSLVDTPSKDFHRYYSYLMDQMNCTAYRWVVERDQDRFLDGLALRDRYDYEVRKGLRPGVDDILWHSDCSVLECLVALFVKYSETVLTDPGDPSVAPELFYDALEHLGLLFYDDRRYNSEEIDDILERFMECKLRLFDVSGVKKSVDLYFLTGKYSMKKW